MSSFVDSMRKSVGVVKDKLVEEALWTDLNVCHHRDYETIQSGSWSFDRNAAVQYAQAHWNDLSPYDPDSDCTNFVSECWNAGGIPMRPGRWFGDRLSGHDFRTPSWYDVGEFANYMINGGFCRVVGTKDDALTEYNIMNNIRQTNIGDVVQFYNPHLEDPTRRWHHSMIIVIKQDNDVFCAGHSERREHRSFQEIVAQTGETYRFLCPYHDGHLKS